MELDNTTNEICEICGEVNYQLWAAQSSLWNNTLRNDDGSDDYNFLCLHCFVNLVRERGTAQHLTVIADFALGGGMYQPVTMAESQFMIESLQMQVRHMEWLMEQMQTNHPGQ